MSDAACANVARFFEIDFHHGPLEKADIARVCREPGLDFLVLEQEVEGVPAVRVGRLYVYCCKDVRVVLRMPDPAAGNRVALGER